MRTVLVVVVMPIVARPLIEAMVRDASPFDGPPLDVDVDVGPSLLGGRVDRIAVGGSGLRRGDAGIESLAVTITSFSVVDRSFAAVAGTLAGVRLPRDDGATVELRTIRLDGPSSAVEAIALIDPAAAESLVRSTLAASGIVPDAVALEAGAIGIVAGGLRADARLEIRAGALTLVATGLVPAITLVAPGPDDPWRLDQVTVAPDGVTIEATIDLDAALAD
jgi:hypothetical protein